MNYNMYLDESGNTGEPRLKDGKWNWGIQQYFALGSVCIPKESAEMVSENILKILQSFDPELGTEKEWKSKANYKFRNELIEKIVHELEVNEAKIYIDITNKKYKVITYIVDYCIFPYYLSNDIKSQRNKSIEMANLLYSTLDNEWIQKFDEICHSDITEDENYLKFIDFLEKFQDYLIKEKLKVDLEEVIKHVKNYESYGLNRKNLFPIRDYNNKGSVICFLPNLDAFLNIISSTSKLRLKKDENLCIYHDKQKQFDQSIIKWTEEMKDTIKLPIEHIEFIESTDNILIQLADYLTGTVVRIYQNCLNSSNIKRNDRDLMKLIKPLIIGNCNVVSTKIEQKNFFDKFGLRVVNTAVPF